MEPSKLEMTPIPTLSLMKSLQTSDNLGAFHVIYVNIGVTAKQTQVVRLTINLHIVHLHCRIFSPHVSFVLKQGYGVVSRFQRGV